MNGTETQLVRRIDKDGKVNLADLSKEELEKYQRISNSLKPSDANSIITYGSNVQDFMAKSSDTYLQHTKMSNVDSQLSELIIELESELKSVDMSDFDNDSFKNILRRLPIIKYVVGTVEKTMGKYDDVLTKVKSISDKISASGIALLKDNQQLEVMLQEDKKAVNALEEYIIAATLKYEETSAKLEEMLANRDKYDEFDIQDLVYFKNNLENKIKNMKLIRYMFKQTITEIRITQDANIKTSDKTKEITSVTIGVWKHQLALAIAAQRSKTAAKNNKMVREATNRLIIENANTIKETAILVEEEAQKSVIDIETLEKSTNTLVECFNELKSLRANFRNSSNDYDAKLKGFEEALRLSATDNVKAIEELEVKHALPKFEASAVIDTIPTFSE